MFLYSGRRSDADHEAPPAPLMPRAPAARRPLSRARRTPGAGAHGPLGIPRHLTTATPPEPLIHLSWYLAGRRRPLLGRRAPRCPAPRSTRAYQSNTHCPHYYPENTIPTTLISL